MQVQRQGASYIDTGYKKQFKVISPQLLQGVIVEGHGHQYGHQRCHGRNNRFFDKKITAVATKPPSYLPAQCFKATKSLEQVHGGDFNKN